MWDYRAFEGEMGEMASLGCGAIGRPSSQTRFGDGRRGWVPGSLRFKCRLSTNYVQVVYELDVGKWLPGRVVYALRPTRHRKMPSSMFQINASRVELRMP